METCTGNKWVLGQECSGTDICRNGEKKDEKTGECTYVDQCDQSGIAKTSWTECIIGTWVARTGSETCERVTERLACGSNMICKSSVCEEGPDYCATVGEKEMKPQEPVNSAMHVPTAEQNWMHGKSA